MPNETLINQINAQYEQYTQQHKAAVALQTSFKAVLTNQNKTQKALAEYRAQNTGTDVSSAQDAFASLRLKEETIDPLLPDLRRELKSLAVLTGALKDTAAALRSEPVDVVRLDKAITVLQTASQQDVLDMLPELNGELALAQRILGDEFGQKLRTALADLESASADAHRSLNWVVLNWKPISANALSRCVTAKIWSCLMRRSPLKRRSSLPETPPRPLWTQPERPGLDQPAFRGV